MPNLTEDREYVYEMFRDAAEGLTVTLGQEIMLSEEAEDDLDIVLGAAEELVEEGEGELDYKQIDVLAMIAVCDVAEFVIESRNLSDGRNFND